MLKFFFRKKSERTKRIYLAGWEAHFNGDQQCENFIATQITNKETILDIDNGIELVFENEKLVKAYDYEYGDKKKRPLKQDELGFPFLDLKPNKYLKLVENENGLHQLGGEIPFDFKLPENKCVVPFQYLGYIEKTEKNFDWLPFKLHLTCPIFLNVGKVFLDYSDNLNPILINREVVERADTSCEKDLKPDSEIIYNEMKFDFVEGFEGSKNGHAGIPNWIQYPGIPVCPKSGKRMRFLCQLNGGVSAKKSNVIPHKESWRPYYEQLNFWGDGDLFVFFEPDSRVCCYFIQNT